MRSIKWLENEQPGPVKGKWMANGAIVERKRVLAILDDVLGDLGNQQPESYVAEAIVHHIRQQVEEDE